MAIIHGNIGHTVSQCAVKLLMREVRAITPHPVEAAQLKWASTPITFNHHDHPENMAGAGELPLIVTPTIANAKIKHCLVDGGAELNILSAWAFDQLQISWSTIMPAPPFGGVTLGAIIPRGAVTLPVTFGTPENFRTEYISFTIARVNLPYNAILGRPPLYKFMAANHYGYLCMKMPGPNEVITIPGDRPAAVAALEKLHTIAVEGFKDPLQEQEPRDQGAPTISSEPLDTEMKTVESPKASPSALRCATRPNNAERVPTKTVHISAKPSQTARIGGGLGAK